MSTPSPPEQPAGPPPRGRFAPSPTGDLHLGSALAALAAWASVRRAGGTLVYRVEDIDGPRVVPGAAERQLADLRWLGLDWDEGPDVGGPHAPYRQSERGAVYEAALERLAAAGHLFPCCRSRRDLLALASAPHGPEGLPPYPAAWRPAALSPDWYASRTPDAALRFRVDAPAVAFEDRVFGRVVEDVRETVGDFVLRRRDGVYAYQLAAVADDLAMGVTEVVRGADLLASTARQILLIGALGGQVPVYAHVPLLVDAEGQKLSKRHGSLRVGALREAGWPSETVVGWLAWALGQQEAPAPRTAAEVASVWDWARVRPQPIHVPEALASATGGTEAV